jgi:hypothetical protein
VTTLDQPIRQFETKVSLPRTGAGFYKNGLPQNSGQDKGEGFLLPLPQLCGTRRKLGDIEKLLGDILRVCSLAEVATRTKSLAVVDCCFASAAPRDDVIPMH